MGEIRISRLNYERARLGLPLINMDELNLLALQWKEWAREDRVMKRLDSKRLGVIYPEDMGGL